MRLSKLVCPALATFAYLAFSPFAHADGREPGSLLIFPEFDNREGDTTMFTITNTNTDDTHNPGTDLPNGTVEVHFIYVGKFNSNGDPIGCLEVNRDIELSPGDTFTFLTRVHNAAHDQGFMYAFARHPTEHTPIDFDYLIGNALFIRGIDSIDYSTNPISLERNEGDDGDTHLDLDGNEYQQLPDEILIPRFLATGTALRSELIFLGLSGGAAFTTIVDLLIYNDNEEVFSDDHSFECWERVPLDIVSPWTTNTFLKTTNHALNEPLGATARESGWIHIDGDIAFSSADQIEDPAVYAVLVEKVARGAGAADLPFEVGCQNNGDLWPNGPVGDGGAWDGQ